MPVISKVWKKFTSLKFTVVLFVILTIIFLAGLVIPQEDLLGGKQFNTWRMSRPALVNTLEYLELTDIYKSKLTIFVWVLFFLNLLAIMLRRIPGIWHRIREVEFYEDSETLRKVFDCREVHGTDIGHIEDVLRRRGFHIYSKGGALHAIRNRLSPLGTILFHGSFIFLLLGGVMSYYTQFTAEVDVAVGETFDGTYRKIKPALLGSLPDVVFAVDSVKPTYFDHTVPVDLDVVLDTPEGLKTIGINRPYRKGATSFVIKDIDVAPLFLFMDDNGREIDGAYFKLKVLKGNEDSFKLLDYDIKTVFFTDISSVNKKPGGGTRFLPQSLKSTPSTLTQDQPREIINPAFDIELTDMLGQVVKKRMRPGDFVRIDNGWLVFRTFTYWVSFYVVKEYGLSIIYAGFILMGAAMVIRLVFYRRDIHVAEEAGAGGGFVIAGRSDFYRALFEEQLDSIVSRIDRTTE